MPAPEATVSAIAAAKTWNQRVALLRQVPEDHGVASHRSIYASLARQLYIPQLTPDFAYVYWRAEYEYEAVAEAYSAAAASTAGFAKVTVDHLATAVRDSPGTTIVWRLLCGYTWAEFAFATVTVAAEVDLNLKPLTADRIKKIERGGGRLPSLAEARIIAEVTCRAVGGTLWPDAPDGRRSKQERPDLAEGWDTVRRHATEGVPLVVLLHQRHYGGAFRQLLDATSGIRGDSLEEELVTELDSRRIPYLRTGSHEQHEIRTRFNITIQPSPDFVFFDAAGSLRAVLEAKLTNDGGTARDKAARFSALRVEGQRLGGIPVFGLLDGLGWARAADALGPVIRDCEGRVFTRATLPEMFEVDPMNLLADY